MEKERFEQEMEVIDAKTKFFDAERKMVFTKNINLFNENIEKALVEGDSVKTLQFVGGYNTYLMTTIQYCQYFGKKEKE